MKLLAKTIKILSVVFVFCIVALLVITKFFEVNQNKWSCLLSNLLIGITTSVFVTVIGSIIGYFIEKEKLFWNIERSFALAYAHLYTIKKQIEDQNTKLNFLSTVTSIDSNFYHESLKNISSYLGFVYSNIENLQLANYAPIISFKNFIFTKEILVIEQIKSIYTVLQTNRTNAITFEKIDLELKLKLLEKNNLIDDEVLLHFNNAIHQIKLIYQEVSAQMQMIDNCMELFMALKFFKGFSWGKQKEIFNAVYKA